MQPIKARWVWLQQGFLQSLSCCFFLGAAEHNSIATTNQTNIWTWWKIAFYLRGPAAHYARSGRSSHLQVLLEKRRGATISPQNPEGKEQKRSLQYTTSFWTCLEKGSLSYLYHFISMCFEELPQMVEGAHGFPDAWHHCSRWGRTSFATWDWAKGPGQMVWVVNDG
jgi:hypothetical protein